MMFGWQRLATVLGVALAVSGFGCSDSDAGVGEGDACDNACTTYPSSWMSACPAGERCIEFKNSCTAAIQLSYQVGCDAAGQPGAPQCNCTLGPEVPVSGSRFWQIVDADDPSCNPAVVPACATAGLAVMANDASDGASAMCATGTRLEFTVGNQANEFDRFDSYDIDVEKSSFTIPVVFRPSIACTTSTSELDCRPLYCDDQDCPDAFITSTSGGCSGRSPAVGCQDTFRDSAGLIAEFCPDMCKTAGSTTCPSCQDNTMCN